MLKKALYYIFVNNRFINLIGSTFLSITIPPIVALYYGTLDIWGDDWAWVKDYKSIHEKLFLTLAIFTVVVLFIKGISDSFKGNVSKKYEVLLESLLVLFNGLVKKKRDRFFQKARTLKPREDAFKKITQPRDQLEHMLDGTKRFLIEGFGIESKNIGVTIIQGKPSQNLWWYEFKCDAQKQHTKAKDLMTKDSTAKYCFENGDSIFIPDIRKGTKEGVFFNSNRSSKSSIGSIFCKAVRVNVNGLEYVYIFTIAVYGQFLCTPYDENECQACEKILDEVADRVELELYLHSMKQYRDSGGKAA
ncbi:TPA: hypothetical protein ACMDRZ_003849 [Vibrio cholerae]|uniref:hypothetical protein n=1 Tax=Vibrio cholerae TaxID=666 RepID=UPI0015816EAC|nr:hypothetical protein [Vibrio cholerae]EJL6781062.1 hypothetical protein [Vibrio cholerae]EKF9639155.1 hypothetical protein [Vibrio cholerae]ELE5880710.1 hypothetical protein [Vibrio cholerae]QKU64667.1 hypothetical protein HPY17_15220 [Vibrio cholerae]QKU68580.1 hypothetical protein HPY10_15435 [Vibrio cholerae]